jgi:hypothetical protein
VPDVHHRRREHWTRWASVYIVLALFAVTLGGQFVAQAAEAMTEADTHGQPFEWSGFWPAYLAAVAENWQSELLQVAVTAVLFSGPLARRWFRADTAASRDDVAGLATKDDLRRIEIRLNAALRAPGRDG